MIDLILSFPDLSAAQSSLPSWLFTDPETGETSWQPAAPGTGIFPLIVVQAEAVVDMSDQENPVETAPRKLADGYWLNISIPDERDEIYDAKQHANLLKETESIKGFRFSLKRMDEKAPYKDCILNQNGPIPDFLRIEYMPSGSQYIWSSQ